MESSDLYNNNLDFESYELSRPKTSSNITSDSMTDKLKLFDFEESAKNFKSNLEKTNDELNKSDSNNKKITS